MRKVYKAGILALSLSALLSFTAFAGEWKQDTRGWWYVNDDGTYPTNSWQWIDGNNDGIAESYYFDPDGYMAVSTTTPDGYTVNGDGAWTEDGVVKTQTASQSGASTALAKTQPPIKLKTNFIKQEFIDVLGEGEPYVMERLASYNPEKRHSDILGTDYTTIKTDTSNVDIYYNTNHTVFQIVNFGGDLFNTSEVAFNLDEKLGGGEVQLKGGYYGWVLSQSPDVRITSRTNSGIFGVFTIQLNE